jgi:hypothetical protein
MPERLIISGTPSGMREYISRARLADAPAVLDPTPDSGELTEVGRKLLGALAAVDGINVRAVSRRHTLLMSLVHANLWLWDEVEPHIIAAWAQILGGQPEIIREGL